MIKVVVKRKNAVIFLQQRENYFTVAIALIHLLPAR